MVREQHKAEFARLLERLGRNDPTLTEMDCFDFFLEDDDLQRLAATLRGNTHLRTLNLGDNRFQAKGAKSLAVALAQNTSLQRLYLGGNRIGDEGAKSLAAALAQNTSLQQLSLRSTSFGDEGAQSLAAALAQNTSLRQLDLNFNGIQVEGAKSLAAMLAENTSIEELDLGWNSIRAEGAKSLAEALTQNTTLRELNLICSNIRDEGAKSLTVALAQNTSLQVLYLGTNNIQAEGAKSLAAALAENTSLRVLEYDYWQDSASDAFIESALKRNRMAWACEGLQRNDPTLTELDCVRWGPDDDDMQRLAAALRGNTHLRKLDLGGNNIQVEGVKSLAAALAENTSLRVLEYDSGHDAASDVLIESALKRNRVAWACEGLQRNDPTLTELDCFSWGLEDDDMQRLAAALRGNTHLRKLDLGRNNIQVEGAKSLAAALAENTSLRVLCLWYNAIGDAGVQALCKGLDRNTAFEKLDLSYNAITDAGAGALATLLRASSTIEEISVTRNHAITRAGHAALASALEFSLARRQLMKEMGTAPLTRPKLFICGFEYSGKTTLGAALQRGRLQCALTRERKKAVFDDLESRTTGVEVRPLRLRDPSSGLLFRSEVEYSLWDFAGQKDFYPTHELFLAEEGGVFAVVCSLSKDDKKPWAEGKGSEEQQREEGLLYWLRFIATRFFTGQAADNGAVTVSDGASAAGQAVTATPVNSSTTPATAATAAATALAIDTTDSSFRNLNIDLPTVILVLSHADSARSGDVSIDRATRRNVSEWGRVMLRKYGDIFRNRLRLHPEAFVVDGRRAQTVDMKALRACLVQQHKVFSARSPPVPKCCEDILASVLPGVRQREGMMVGLERLREQLCQQPFAFLKTDALFYSVLRYFHATGELVWLEGEQCRSVVILQPQWFTKEVIGAVLAPASFHTAVKEAEEGKVTLTDLTHLFCDKWRDTKTVLDLLYALDLCFPVDDDGASPTAFMFPARLRAEASLADLWPRNEQLSSCIGRRLLCQSECDMFSAGFFPRLQVRLQREFGSAGEAVVTLWRRSAMVRDKRDTLECMLRIHRGARAVDVWARCEEGVRDTCMALVERIVRMAQELQVSSCPGAVTETLILSEEHLRLGVEEPSGWRVVELQGLGPAERVLPSFECPDPKVAKARDVAGRLLPASAFRPAPEPSFVTPAHHHAPNGPGDGGDAGPAFDVFLSHNWDMGNHARVVAVARQLERRGLRVWLDDNQMRGNIIDDMWRGIDKSRAVLVFLTQAYIKKVASETQNNCKREFLYAVLRKAPKGIVPVVMEEGVRDQRAWEGAVGMELGSELYALCEVEDIVDKLKRKGLWEE